ncbi:group 1 truncated hemoglobin [Methylotenera sp.]|uniref:group I truncated hemoglobin n=1 Tax=Methylotenera sp. TaxID=2051956 RepID=UPI0027237940|nr:group 1 truncated hemoglobin [Methylotenera sp.]MDO9204964.1 group 1 truncated hemoglobin [Methylotenera sp.]MDO9393685.1 group 1 truncated hemoglobin [Methylotenera sp.]MDP1523513.1 group 1 truncated hemoglobin [Methylotenera sp.]MDP2071152.1 group 1 truncated hemoglobin [Methylotenera sp.]MDP2230077.1 group 1 truncated hemoglobin [Methylotenera sp.]
MTTLFEQLGGQEAIDAVVDHFYNIMLKDDRVKHFFVNTDMARQRNHQKRFVAVALGGPNLYDGRAMREGHTHLVEKMGLNDSHFDATVQNLGRAMRDLNVTENLIVEVAAIVETTRYDVLNKQR